MHRKSRIDKKEERDVGQLDILPDEIFKHVFTFFTRKNLQEMQLVNKTFHAECQAEMAERKEKYKDNIFYALGDPLAVTYTGGMSGMYYYKIRRLPRTDIIDDEIVESFKSHIETVRLFKTEEDALNYCKCLSFKELGIFNEPIYQPAVFKVVYLDVIHPENFKEENFKVDEQNALKVKLMDKSGIKEYQLSYFDTARVNVIPVEARLVINRSSGKYFCYPDKSSVEEKHVLSSCFVS